MTRFHWIVLWIAVALAAAVTALPLIFYAAKFGGPLSPLSAEWSNFGTFLAGTAGTGLAIINLLVVLFIAVSLQTYQADQAHARSETARKREQTFAMHREWNEPAMYAARSEAGSIVRQKDCPTLDVLWQTDPSDVVDVWLVLGFYQRLSLALKHEHLEEKLVPDLFGSTFVWWHYHSFSKQLPEKWESHPLITELHQWLIQHASQETAAEWLKRAKAYDDQPPPPRKSKPTAPALDASVAATP